MRNWVFIDTSQWEVGLYSHTKKSDNGELVFIDKITLGNQVFINTSQWGNGSILIHLIEVLGLY